MLSSASAGFLGTLSSLFSQWAFALLVGCLGFLALYILLCSIPSIIRDKRWFWLLEIAVLPLAVTFLASLPIALFDLSESDVWFNRVHEVKGVLLALVFAYIGTRALNLFVWQGVLRRYASTLPGIVRNLVAFFVYLAAVYAILAYVFEQPVTGLLVSSGIALGVLGLAFQSTLTDIITGVALAIERPFGVGDWIETDDGMLGEVESIDWRATSLKTLSNTTHVIPNNKIANTSIHNLSRPGPTYCIKVHVRVTADIPPWEVSRLLLEAAIAAPEVAETPAPIVRLADAEHRPLRYLALIHCTDYGNHPAVRASFLHHAWRLLNDAGAQIAADTQQIDFQWARKLEYQGPTDANALNDVELLRPLRAEERKRLLMAGTTHEFPENVPIVELGDEGQSFFAVLSGIVRIFLPADETRTADLELARLGAGSYFGEMSLLTGEKRSASISSHTRARILEIPKRAMAQVLDARPELADELAQIMAERKLATEGALRDSDEMGFADRLAQTTRELLQRMQSFFGES